MTKIITIGQQKGGAGKTTVAAHIAVSLLQTGRKVAIIDIDPQASLSEWHKLREKKFGEGYTGLHFLAGAGWRLDSLLREVKGDYDYIVIDAPPHTQTETKTAIRASDLVIIPMQASPTDLWATESTLEFANGENINSIILLNRLQAGSNLAKDILSKIKHKRFKNSLGNRVAFSSCFLNGATVTEVQPNSQAAIEVRNVTDEILALLGDHKKNKIAIKKELQEA